MSQEQLVSYLPLFALAAFFVWRAFKVRVVKSQIPDLLKQGAVIVDVRNPDEFAAGSNPNSINIPLGQIDARSKELDRTRPMILCCASGARSGMAVGILKKNGFDRVVNAGSWVNTL